jgi:hypothetical protein
MTLPAARPTDTVAYQVPHQGTVLRDGRFYPASGRAYIARRTYNDDGTSSRSWVLIPASRVFGRVTR